MKKLIAFLTLLLCVSFTEMFAQQTVRWSVGGNATSLVIKVNGIIQVNSNSSGATTSGILPVNVGDHIEVYSTSLGVLYPIITEDDEWMLAHYAIVEGDDYWFDNGRTSLSEYFVIQDTMNMYVGMSTW